MIGVFFGFDKHIVNIDFHGLAHQWLKYLCYQPLIGRSDILQAKRHYIVAVYLVWCNEGCFLHIRWVHRNLVVVGESVQK